MLGRRPARAVAWALLLTPLALAIFASCACGGAAAPLPPPAPAAPPPAPPPEEPPAGGPPTQVDCGDFASCARASDGTVRCWGRDKQGELGDGGGQDRAKPRVIKGLAKVVDVAMASQFGCALLEDKHVKCWGSGRIANDGKPYDKSPPIDVAGVESVEELVASGAIACARTAKGVTCWGTDPATIGTPPTSGAVKQISIGFTHGCALDKAGAVTCWGGGGWTPKGPFGKPSISGATYIATGDRHACVVSKDKKVLCWGLNDAGQLGTKPDGDSHKQPTAVPGVTGAVKLAAGESSTCAMMSDGSLRCWGTNAEGELGTGTRSPDERPSRVAALSEVGDLCFGSTHACALTGGSLSCWGANGLGQLGDGSHERRLQPTRVAW